MTTSDIEVAGTSIGAALAALAEKDPRRPAVTDDVTTLTRAELERRTNRLARAYLELGARPGSFVTIGLPNSSGFIEASIAAWKLGATPQPISHRLPVRERQGIIALADPSLLVGVDRSEAGGPPAVPDDFEVDPALSDEPLAPAVAPYLKAPASGGSTGVPKLIVATQPAVVEPVLPFARLLHMTDDGVELTTGPLYHNGPFFTAVCALLTGNHVVVMNRFDPARCLELVQRHGVDWMYAVPTMMLRIWRLPAEERESFDLSSLRVVMHMAAPCPTWLKRAWIEWLGPERVFELFAATEVQAVTVISGDEWLAHPGSVGRPVVGEVAILDADGGPVPAGTVGEIWMRRGPDAPPPYRYIGADARCRPGGWESVGDMGWLDEDGYLYPADRDTDMILVGGANVYPAEVEAALEEHPAVRSACVIGLPDEDLGSTVHAIIQVIGPVTEAELDAHLRERLVSYKLPRSFERVEEPLRDEAGKVRRSALRQTRLAMAGS